MGSTRASRVVFGALAGDVRFRPFHVIFNAGVKPQLHAIIKIQDESRHRRAT